MRTQRIGKHQIELYETVDEMPITVFHLYNKYLLIDSGIGSDMQAVDNHITRLNRYIATGNIKDGKQELMNLRQSIYFVMESVSPKFMSYACLVYSIDGKRIYDRSEEGLQDILKRISSWGANKKTVYDLIDGIKKKNSEELDIFFPELSDNAGVKEFYAKLKTRTMHVLQTILGEDKSKEVEAIDEFLFSLDKPKMYDGRDGMEVNYIKSFEEMCTIMSQHVNRDPKTMTVMEYYQTLSVLKKQFKKK